MEKFNEATKLEKNDARKRQQRQGQSQYDLRDHSQLIPPSKLKERAEGCTRMRAVPTTLAMPTMPARLRLQLCTTKKVRSLRSATTSTRAHTTQLHAIPPDKWLQQSYRGTQVSV
eukprot:4496756-Amphidinium_carterae.3